MDIKRVGFHPPPVAEQPAGPEGKAAGPDSQPRIAPDSKPDAGPDTLPLPSPHSAPEKTTARAAAAPGKGNDPPARTQEAAVQGQRLKRHLQTLVPAESSTSRKGASAQSDALAGSAGNARFSIPPAPAENSEASAISSLRTCVSSQAMYYQGDLDRDETYDYATSLEDSGVESDLIDDVLGGPSSEDSPTAAGTQPTIVKKPGKKSKSDG
jgi:hypothetical protein